MRHVLFVLLLGWVGSAKAEAPAPISVMLKDHRFSPAEVHVPSGRAVTLLVINADDEMEEFDSSALKIEAVIPGGHRALIRLRPLGPGRFPFMGEYHPDTATGVVVSE